MITPHPLPPLWPWIVSGVSVMCLVLALVWGETQNRYLAEQGYQTHKAICTLKSDYAKRVTDSQTFLSMTVKQRENKYGLSLGRIPESVIRQSLRGLEANLESLKTLDC